MSTVGAFSMPQPVGQDFSAAGGTAKANLTGTPASVQVSAKSGRILRAVVNAAGGGTNGWLFYDGTSASGTPVGAVPATATVGQAFDLRFPIATGIFAVAAGANPPNITLSYE